MKPAALALFFLVPLWPQALSEAEQLREIEARFAAVTPADLAWGAYLAGQYSQPRFVPRIVDLLQSPDRPVRTAAFDALIRLGADLPDEVLSQHARQHFGEVVILASRTPRLHANFLLGLLGADNPRPVYGDRWVALNSILGQIRSPDHVRRLLSEWSIKIRVAVTAPGSRPRWPSDRQPPGLCGDEAPPPPRYPPVQSFYLHEAIRNDTPSIVGGPHPVIWTRGGACELPFDQDAYRLDYLRWIAGDFQDPLPPLDLHVQWSGSEAYRDGTEGSLGRIRKFVVALRSAVTEDGLIDADAPGPQLDVNVLDQRSDRNVPLPPIDWRF